MSFDPLAFVRITKDKYSSVMAEIRRLTDEGLSGNAILRDFTERGIQIRRQTFLSLRRDALGIRQYSEQLSTLRNESFVPRSWHYNPENWELSRKYLYTFEYDIQNVRTGDVITDQFGALATDEFLSVGTLKDKKQQQLEVDTEESQWIVTRIVLHQALSR